MDNVAPAMADAPTLDGRIPTAHDCAGRRPWRRLVLLCAGLIGAAAAVWCAPVRSWLEDVDSIRHWVASMGIWGYPACILIMATLVGCGVPRLIFCAVAGMLFRFWLGLLLIQSGTMLGYYGAFLFVRWGGRDWVLHRWPQLRKWADLMRQQGVMGVILLRQLPIHGSLINLCLGLSRVKHRQFLIGTLIGSIPEAIPVTLAGAGLMKASLAGSIWYLTLALAACGILWIGCGYAAHYVQRRSAASSLAVEVASVAGAAETGRAV